MPSKKKKVVAASKLNVRIDAKVLRTFKEVCEESGLKLQAATEKAIVSWICFHTAQVDQANRLIEEYARASGASDLWDRDKMRETLGKLVPADVLKRAESVAIKGRGKP